jgi:hypothetical protein
MTKTPADMPQISMTKALSFAAIPELPIATR